MATRFTLDVLVDDFKVLGDKTRLTILTLLKDGERCVCELTDILGISQPGVSQQMRKLRQAGLVKERRGGQWIYYSLNPDNPLLQILLPILPDSLDNQKRVQSTSQCKTRRRHE